MKKNGIHITGFLGKPIITRGNRNFENFFVNGRYVKSAMISKSVEDAYRDFVMQHKFPFAVLHFHLSGEKCRYQCASDKDGTSLLTAAGGL